MSKFLAYLLISNWALYFSMILLASFSACISTATISLGSIRKFDKHQCLVHFQSFHLLSHNNSSNIGILRFTGFSIRTQLLLLSDASKRRSAILKPYRRLTSSLWSAFIKFQPRSYIECFLEWPGFTFSFYSKLD